MNATPLLALPAAWRIAATSARGQSARSPRRIRPEPQRTTPAHEPTTDNKDKDLK